MRILAIETSCDETAIAILDAGGPPDAPFFSVRGQALYSQAHTHAPFGGVYPNLAKREHQKNLIPLLQKVMTEAGLLQLVSKRVHNTRVDTLLEHEPELRKQFTELMPSIARPDIDLIAVTEGPGLEPALWVGINFAKALGHVWQIPVAPINHMEGHMVSVLAGHPQGVKFPAVALLLSGGHTELVEMRDWGSYTILGETRDDAVGEAFDKVARMLSLPYPGGPEISKAAARTRGGSYTPRWDLPRPMIASNDLDFSFSGLKTAVRYRISDKKLSASDIDGLAREFEDAVADVVIHKTRKALKQSNARTLIFGGGVSANAELRSRLADLSCELGVALLFPPHSLSTDNAVMIAIASYMRYVRGDSETTRFISARGTLPLSHSK